MVLNGFDSVKAVKAIAMANYTRRRKLKWFFEFFVFFFLVFHRSSLFSLAGPLLRHFLRRLVLVLNSHIFVFVVFHAMLFVVYSLSRLTDNKSGSNRTDDAESGTVAASGDQLPDSGVAPIEDSVAEILVVGEKNTATSQTEMDGIIEAESTPSPTPATAPGSPVRHLKSVTETEEITPEKKQYRRTESERFEENRERSKFRRSKTEIGRRESREETARLLNPVDEMDIEDFNRTVESFILEQKMYISGRISG